MSPLNRSSTAGSRARYEHRTRQSKMERKRAEKLAGGSLGRSFARSFTGGLSSSGGDPERGDGSSTGPFDTGTLSRAKMRVTSEQPVQQ